MSGIFSNVLNRFAVGSVQCETFSWFAFDHVKHVFVPTDARMMTWNCLLDHGRSCGKACFFTYIILNASFLQSSNPPLPLTNSLLLCTSTCLCKITRGFMSPRLTVVRRSRSRTVGSDTIASASSLPIIVGRQQSSSPERTTPEKKPPCVSNDSPERTGNSNDSRGRENVCDVSEMYEFLDTTRSAGGRKTFDEASGAGDRDSITTFAGTVVEVFFLHTCSLFHVDPHV